MGGDLIEVVRHWIGKGFFKRHIGMSDFSILLMPAVDVEPIARPHLSLDGPINS